MGCSHSKPEGPPEQTLPSAPKQVSQQSIVTETPAPQPTQEAPSVPVAAQEEPAPVEPPKPVEPVKPQAVGVRDEECDAFSLILCGAGESGKTTFTRQLKLRYLGGFSEEERRDFVETIRINVIESMQILISWVQRQEQEFDEDVEDIAAEFEEIDPLYAEFDEELAENIKELWNSDAIKEAFSHRNETTIPDHMDFFFNKVEELANPDYLPNDEDVLKARIRTIGYEAVTFNLNGALIRIYDVGGQKNERSKWEQVFEKAEGCIFCASFAEFDKPMFEDKDIMRINDAFGIFNNVTHKEKFLDAPIFLVCNKLDVFENKVRTTDAFARIFPEYRGDIHNPEECCRFLVERFIEQSLPEVPERPIQVHKIVALDSNDVISTADSICKYISDNYFD